MPKDINRANSYSSYKQFQYSSGTKEATSTHHQSLFCLAGIVWDFSGYFGLGLGWLVERGRRYNTGHNGPKSGQLSLEYLLKFWKF